jgi:hypothetical protein
MTTTTVSSTSSANNYNSTSTTTTTTTVEQTTNILSSLLSSTKWNQLSKNEQSILLYNVQNRPTRTAADEFLNNSNYPSMYTTTTTGTSSTNTSSLSTSSSSSYIDWKTLPKRLQILCNTIDIWVSGVFFLTTFFFYIFADWGSLTMNM